MMSCMLCKTFPGFKEISFKILIVISLFFNLPLAASVSNSLSLMIKMYMFIMFISLHSRRPKWNGTFICYIYIFANVFLNK